MAVDTNLITALGAGSGVDIKALAQGLANAEIEPRKAAVQAKIDKSEAKISGYSAMMAVLDGFKEKVDAIDSTTDFASTSARISNSSVASVTTSSLAAPATHSLEVHALARAQRSVSNAGYDNVTANINNGDAFRLTLTVGSGASEVKTDIDIAQGSTNPSAIVSAINQSSSGITAQLLDTGVVGSATRYKIVLTGQMGSAKSFSVSTNAANADLTFATPAGQAAADASLTVNGVTVTRSSNTVSDVVTGVTFDLQATNTGSPASVQVTRDASGVKEKISGLVQAYNDMVSDFGILTGPKSEDEEDVFSGALNGDSTARAVLSQIRQIFFGESETKGSAIRSFRDLGISVDREGVLTLDESMLDNAISSNFEEVVQALAQRTTVVENGQTVAKRGLGVNLAAKLREIMSPSGVIVSQTNSAESQVARYESQLTTLEDRLEKILARYTKQFAAMESLVGQITAMRENLKGQFEGLANAYKK